ncbi:MAG: NAD(P)-dependent oxidoreductase [Thermomicrobiales bacterium]
MPTTATTTTILIPASDAYVGHASRNVASPADILRTLPNVRLLAYTRGEDLPIGAEDASILVSGGANTVADLQGFPASLPNLKLIQTLSAGVNNWLGKVPENVILSNARGAHGAATAEWALTALLTIFRDFPRYVRQQETRTWERVRSDGLQEKRVLIVGAGDLATRLQRRLLACDAEVTLVGRHAREGVRTMAELPDLLPTHDAVVIMVPQTAATTGLVDAAFLAAMPDGAVLINAARGPIVDTEALLVELASGRLRAGLDVTDPEPLPADHPLWDAPNVLITPHVGGAVERGDERAWATVREQIAQFLETGRPANAFDPADTLG